MNKFFNSNNDISLAINNLKKYNKNAQRKTTNQQIKYINYNNVTPSHYLNDYLYRQVIALSKPITPVPLTKDEKRRNVHFNLLQSSSSSDLLTYKGINLGSAINMKLSVQLASLLKDKEL